MGASQIESGFTPSWASFPASRSSRDDRLPVRDFPLQDFFPMCMSSRGDKHPFRFRVLVSHTSCELNVSEGSPTVSIEPVSLSDPVSQELRHVILSLKVCAAASLPVSCPSSVGALVGWSSSGWPSSSLLCCLSPPLVGWSLCFLCLPSAVCSHGEFLSFLCPPSFVWACGGSLCLL